MVLKNFVQIADMSHSTNEEMITPMELQEENINETEKYNITEFHDISLSNKNLIGNFPFVQIIRTQVDYV